MAKKERSWDQSSRKVKTEGRWATFTRLSISAPHPPSPAPTLYHSWTSYILQDLGTNLKMRRMASGWKTCPKFNAAENDSQRLFIEWWSIWFSDLTNVVKRSHQSTIFVNSITYLTFTEDHSFFKVSTLDSTFNCTEKGNCLDRQRQTHYFIFNVFPSLYSMPSNKEL